MWMQVAAQGEEIVGLKDKLATATEQADTYKEDLTKAEKRAVQIEKDLGIQLDNKQREMSAKQAEAEAQVDQLASWVVVV